MPYLTTLSALSLLTIISSFLGFWREILIAKVFGVSSTADCFIVAFSTVSSVFLIFNTSTIQTAFMPSYQQCIIRGNLEEASRIFNGFLQALTLILLILALIIFFAGGYYVPWVVPGFNEASITLTIKTIKILTPLILTLGLSGLFFAVCNVNQRFLSPLFSQLVNNVSIIFFLLTGMIYSATLLAWSFFIGGVLSFLTLIICTLPFITKRFSFHRSKIPHETLSYSFPIFILVIFEQFGTMVQKTIASGLETGSIAALNYSYKLAAFPITIFVIPIAIIFFPVLINYVETKSSDLENYFHKGIGLIIYCLLPATLFFLINSKQIVIICFGGENFDSAAIEKTSSALLFYAFGLVAQGFLIYLNKVYFAYKQAKLFLKLSFFGGAIHILSCWIFCKFFGHIGIAIGTSIYSIINTWILFFNLKNFSNLSINLRIFMKPTLAILITFFLTHFFSKKDGLIFLIIDIGLISIPFYGSLWLMKDREFRKLLTNGK